VGSEDGNAKGRRPPRNAAPPGTARNLRG